MPTASPRPPHRPSRRHAILEASLAELARRPLQDVTVADIATRAGMTPAAVYYHFPSKTDLVEELVRQIGATYVDVTAAPDHGAPEERIRAVLERFLEWVERSPDEASLYFVMSPGASPTIEALRRSHLGQVVARTAGILAAARPGLGPAEAHVIALAMATILSETAVARLTEPESSGGRLEDALTLALRALG